MKTFRLRLEKDVFYVPGQYLSLTLNFNSRDMTKVFSISSSPTEKGRLDFTKKLTDSVFSEALKRLSPGDEVLVRLPLGQFVMKDEYQKIAFLSGGIGITPIRSMLKYATDLKLSKNLILLYSSRNPEYLIFKNELDAMCRLNKNLKVYYTLTDKMRGEENFESGYINSRMVKEKIPDYSERIFYVCGPPGMVSSIQAMLKDELAVASERIIVEHFMGYD